MASAGFGKIRPKKQKVIGKPYDADRKESFLGRMKSKVKDMLTPSWLYAPAATYGSDDDDGREGQGSGSHDDVPPDERADTSGAASAMSASVAEKLAAAPSAAASASAETRTGAAEQRSTTSASQNMRSALAEPRKAFGAAATAAAAAQAKGSAVTSVFPSPEVRKRVRRDFFHLAEDGAPVKRQRVAGAMSSADGGASASSSSLAVIPDDSDAYQRDILLMSKRSLEHHKHDLSPKESESTESELTGTASTTDKSAAAVHPSSSYVSDGDTLNGPTLQSVKPSFSVSTFTSSFTSLNESTSFLNAPASGESSFYAGKTTFGGASAYRRTPLAVSIQPSTRSALFTKRTHAAGSTAVTSATAKRILDTLEKMASPAPATVRSKDSGSSSISQSAADTLLAFKPLPYLSRRRMQPASKLTLGLSSQPAPGSFAVPPLAKLPTVNASGMAGRKDALANDSSGILKANLPIDHPKSLSAKVEAVPLNGIELRGNTDLSQKYAAASGVDKAGGKLKPSRERGRAHYSRPSAVADEVEPAPFASNLSTAFTLPAEAVKGFDLCSAKPAASLPSTTERACAAPSTVDGSVLHTQFSFSSPVALQPSVPDNVTKTQSDIKPFVFRNPADVDKSVGAGHGFAASGESRPGDAKASEGAALVASSLVKAGGNERSSPLACAVSSSLPVSAASPAVGVSSAGAGAWSGTLLASTSAAGSWDCDACMVNNEPGSSTCCACGSRRQAAERAGAAPPPPSVPAAAGAASVDIFKQPVDIFKQPPAGWECSACLVRNGTDKSRCVACNSARPSKAEAPATAAAQQPAKVAVDIFKQPPTGWECGACLLRNSSGAIKCVACGSAKVGSVESLPQNSSPSVDIFKQPAAGWECTTCMLRNSSDKAKCVACSSSKPVSSGAQTSSVLQSGGASSLAAPGNGFGNIFKQPSGSWNCTECFVQNKPDAAQCAACGSRKPGISAPAAQPKPSAEASGLSASSQVTTSDQTKSTTAIKFGGASSGGSLFGTTFKPLPTVLKFGGEQPPQPAASSLQVTSSTDKDVQSKAASSGNAQLAISSQPSFSMAHTVSSENKAPELGPKLPAFTSFGAMPSSINFGTQPLARPGATKDADRKPTGQNTEDSPKALSAMPADAQAGPLKSASAFAGQPTPSSTLPPVFGKPAELLSASTKPFTIGGSSDSTAGFAAQSSSLFGSTKQPPISFGLPAKEEAKNSATEMQQDGQLSLFKSASGFGGGLQSSAFIVPPVAVKPEEPGAALAKPFAFGASAPTSGGLSMLAPSSSSALSAEVAQKPPTFVFGNPGHQTQSSASSSIASGSALVFGGPPQAVGSSSLPAAGFAFGNTQVQPKPPAAEPASFFKFGSAAMQPQGSSDAAPKNPASVFGSASSQSQGNTVASKVPLLFGSTSLQTQAALSAPTGGFSFGGASAQSAEANSSKSGFGQQSVMQSSGFNFGKAASLPPTSAAGGLFQFGGPQKTDTDRGSGSFTFGSGAAVGSSVGTALFGGSAPAQPGGTTGNSASDTNPFAPSQGTAGRTIRKIPRKFNK